MAQEQTALVNEPIEILVQVIGNSGSHEAATINTSTTRIDGFPATVPTVTSVSTGVFKISFSGVTPAPVEGDRLTVLVNGTVTSTGAAWSTYCIPVKILANDVSSFDAATDAVANVTTVTNVTNVTNAVETDLASRNASKADVSSLALASQVSALNDFNPATDTVANVTNTANVTNAVETDVASRNASKADVSGLSTFDASTDQVVASNMRGTDGANTIAPDNAGIAANNTAINNLNDLSSQDVENAVWDAPYASHVLANTFGKLMDLLRKANRAIDAEVAGTPTASAFDTNLSGYTDGAFDHELLVFVSGTLNGEARPILSYSSANGRITFEEPLTGIPSVSDEFIILPYHTTPTSEIQDGLVKVGQQFTYTNQAGDSHQVTIS